MKKYKIIRIVTILVIFIAISTNYTFATKEDLKTPSEKDELSFTASDVQKACKYFDTDKDGHISVEELQTKIDSGKDIDKYLTILRIQAGADENSPAGQTVNYFRYKTEDGQMAWNMELVELINKEHNKRREEEGLPKINNTTLEHQANATKYYAPEKVGSTDTATKGIDDAMGDAKKFVSNAKSDIGQVNDEALQSFSSTFYNIFLTAGVAIAVITGMIIGIKYMIGSVEEKADIKTMLIPYVVGCIVVFGAFGIWKLVVVMLESM